MAHTLLEEERRLRAVKPIKQYQTRFDTRCAMFAINGIEFTLVEAIVWLIVAAICGAVGSAIVGYSAGGLLASIGVGLIGAMIGTWIARAMGLPALLTFTYGGVTIDLLWTILGSVILVALVSLLRSSGRGRYRRVA
jgi:uncharacterized membrane protein YeaQ/YmgE (transglycosylase-associated protein family)